MEKLNINLLPQEFSDKQKQQRKLKKVQTICIGLILLLIFLVSATLTLRIIQLESFKKIEVKAKEAEVQVSEYKDKEAALTVLKQRINIIRQVKSFPSKTSDSFGGILEIIPPDVIVSSSSVDKNGTILISVIASSSESLEKLLENILDKGLGEQYKKVEIESLSGGRDGSFRANFKILPK